MKQLFVTLLFILFGVCSGRAQTAPTAEAEQQIMQQAAFIFEGELVNNIGYFNAEKSRLYNSSVIRITHVLKGALEPGTVQVVSRGPRVSGIHKDPKTGEITIALPVDNGHGNSDNQGIDLPKGKRIVFFCRSLSGSFEPKPERVSTDNSNALEIVGLAYDIFRNNTFVSDIGGKFASQQDLYRYLNRNYQVPLPAAERSQTEQQRDSAGKENRRQWDLMEQRIREIKEANQKKSKSAPRNRSGAVAPQATQELTFTIQNPTVTGTTIKYLEYDVFVRSSTGNSYFSNAVMEFGYNTAAFGNGLGTIGNSQITVTRGSAFPASTYRQANAVDGNDPTPTFRVGVGVIINGTGLTEPESLVPQLIWFTSESKLTIA